jgi:streptogramin lyase
MEYYKNCSVLSLTLILWIFSFSGFGQDFRLEKKWETPAELKEPESVIYDSNEDVLYVSNINNPPAGKDGNGSIGKISLNGEIQEVEWVIDGMDSPKGLGLFNGLLYVADLKKVVVINTKTGKLEKTIEIPDAGMLNDITVDDAGIIYISDSDRGRIYTVKNGTAEIWIEKDFFQKPNGLLAHQGAFYMIDMNSGIFYEINKKTKVLRKIAEGLIGADGIAPYGNDFFISNWNGEINFVSSTGNIKN